MTSKVFTSGTIIDSAWLNDVNGATYNGSAVFTPAGVGAIPSTTQNKLRENISVLDFGADPTGVIDSTAAIQSAITYAGKQLVNNAYFTLQNYSTSLTVDFPSGVYKISGGLLLPPYVILQGNNSTLVGNGYASGTNTCFTSAYWNAGVLTSNIGTGASTYRLQYTQVSGFKLYHFALGFNVFNMNEGCKITDIAFADCYQSIVADYSFYCNFYNCTTRDSVGTSTLAAHVLKNFVNVELFDSMFCIGRTNSPAFQLTGGASSMTLRNCSAETGLSGIALTGQTYNVRIEGCYFEGLTYAGIDMGNTGSHSNVTIDNNWFYQCGTGIIGYQMGNGNIGRGNYFDPSNTVHIAVTDLNSFVKLEAPTITFSDTATSKRPNINVTPKITYGGNVWFEQPTVETSNATGNALVRQTYSGGLINLPYSGKQGYVPNQVAFCDWTISGLTNPASFFIDTSIVFDTYVMVIYSFVITDNSGVWYVNGRGFCNQLVTVNDTATGGRTTAISNNGGFVRITVGQNNNATGGSSIEGIVRMP